MIFVALALASLGAAASAERVAPLAHPAPPPSAPVLATHGFVTPASARVLAGASFTFRAAFAGGSGSAVTWSLVGPGTIDAGGTYAAPAAPGERAVVLATSGSASAAATVLAVAPPAPDRSLVLVACYDGGSIDVRDGAAVDEIGMASTGGSASSIAFGPDGDAFVADGDRIGIFDPSSGRVALSEPVAGARFSEIAPLADGYVAATDNQAAAGQDGVRIFGPAARGSAPHLVSSAPTGDTPEGIAVSADGRSFFVTNVNSDSVMRFAFDGRGSARLLGAAKTGHRPFGVALDEGRRLLFVADNDTPTLSGAASAPGLEVYSLPAMRLIRRVVTGSPDALPLGIAVDARANRLFVTNEGDGDVAVYSIAPLRRIATLGAGRTPWLPYLDRERGRLFVPNAGDDSLDVFDVKSLRPVARGVATCGYPTSVTAR